MILRGNFLEIAIAGSSALTLPTHVKFKKKARLP